MVVSIARRSGTDAFQKKDSFRRQIELTSLFHLGVAGLYDYGPPGSSLQANIISEWRKHFVIEEHMLELDTTIMTPSQVFETSGHVARFADWMVKDTKTGEVLRADHLVKGVLEARLAGDREARGKAAEPEKEDDKKKKKKKVKTTAVKLEDSVVEEYESILAQVSVTHLILCDVLTKFVWKARQLLRPRAGGVVSEISNYQPGEWKRS